MLNMKNVTSIALCSVMISSAIPAYAESMGSISINVEKIAESKFQGEIYVILADKDDNQKLVLLKSDNNYTQQINSLEYGEYIIKDIYAYDAESDEYNKSRERAKLEYTLEYSRLNLSDDNKNGTITLIISKYNDWESNPKSKSDNSDSESNDIEDKNDTSEDIENTEDESIDEEQTLEEKKANEESIAKRKKYKIFNLIFDVIAITSLGAIWFFKIKDKKKED